MALWGGLALFLLVPSGPTPATQTVLVGRPWSLPSHCGGRAEVTGLEDSGQLRVQLTGRNWNQVWGRALTLTPPIPPEQLFSKCLHRAGRWVLAYQEGAFLTQY